MAYATLRHATLSDKMTSIYKQSIFALAKFRISIVLQIIKSASVMLGAVLRRVSKYIY